MTNPMRRFSSPSSPGSFRLVSLTLLGGVLFCSSPAFAVSKDMVQLQTQIQTLQDAVARLQQSNDERMGVLKDLLQQNADTINKLATVVEALQKQVQTQQETQGTKSDQLSGQIQSLNDSIDEIKARMASLQKTLQDIQSQQQTMSLPAASQPQTSTPPADAAPAPAAAPTPAPIVRKGKPSADVPVSQAPVSSGAGVTSADDLYKAALGDYMSAKYSLAASEFADVTRNYPDNPLAGNSFYYQAEIAYRGGQYQNAIKNYDSVVEQYPDSNKVPVSHLHKGTALLALKENEAGIRELRLLIQRFPNSPEAMQARSKLSGMGVAVTPKH